MVMLVLDRYTKVLAVEALSAGQAIPFIPGFLDFLLVYNEGAAFGILEGARLYFLVTALIACIAIIIYLALAKRHSLLRVIALALICAGAVGNAIDRFISGKVVDFIHTLFIEFPLFNIADSAITVGVIAMILSLLLTDDGRSGRRSAGKDSLTDGETDLSADHSDENRGEGRY